MKQIAIAACTATLLIFGTVSCKDNEKKEMNTEAQEVTEASGKSIQYLVDGGASSITWKGNKPTGSHNGTIDVVKGKAFVNSGVLEAGSFVIDMTTIASEDLEGGMKENLEKHLMGTVEGKEGDFFNVNKYPTADFELTGVSSQDGKTMINGNLRIKDKTNNVSFPAEVTMDGNTLTITSETFELDRTLWGVNYGSKNIFDNLGDKFIDDEMELTVTLVAKK